MRVRVVEELHIDPDDPRYPGEGWHPRPLSGGATSVVGLLTPEANDFGVAKFRLIGMLDRQPALEPMHHPRLMGFCDGGGMVFQEGSDGVLLRRWVVFPMDATGQFVS
jgi:hypothetical protein